MDTICVSVCTARRPQMLQACLASLAAQEQPRGALVVLVVVDNEASPNNRIAVEAFAKRCPFPVVYSHRPEPGIPFARNRAIDEALRLKADWIAFIDDDETAAPNWISTLYSKAKERGADVIEGHSEFRYPDPRPFWAIANPVTKGKRDGITIRQAGTNNVIFSTRLVRPDGLALRFDEALRYQGGSDIRFFSAASKAGARMYFCRAALAFEFVPASRLSLAYLLGSYLTNGVCVGRQYVSEKGRVRAALKYLPRLFSAYVKFILKAPLFLFTFFADRDNFKREFLREVIRLGSAAGTLMFLLGLRIDKYKVTHGF